MTGKIDEGHLETGELSRSKVQLTQEQLARMQQEELLEFNPNLVDTPEQAAAHGFVWKHGPVGS